MPDDTKKPKPFIFENQTAFPIFVITAMLIVLGVLYGFFAGLRQYEPTAERLINQIAQFWGAYINPVVVILDTLLLGVILFLLIQILPVRYTPRVFDRPRKGGQGQGEEKAGGRRAVKVVRQWSTIRERAVVPTASNLRLSIIDADTLVDTFLKDSGILGTTMAERLQLVNPNEAPSLQRVWDAHKLRNELVHTPGFPVSPAEARGALKSFEDFLREMGGL